MTLRVAVLALFLLAEVVPAPGQKQVEYAPGFIESQIAAKAAALNLGKPSPETPAPVRTASSRVEGWWQSFENGRVYWSPAHGAHVVWGDVFARWNAMQAEQGVLGFPRTDELFCARPDARDRFQIFDGGRINWVAATRRTYIHLNPTNFGENGDCSLPEAAPTELSPAPPPAPTPTPQARFRVTLNGFTVHSQTVDHLFEADGKGDEVYLRADVISFREAGAVEQRRSLRSVVMGDINNQNNPPRIQAGGASDRGGLRNSDPFPGSEPWVRTEPPLADRPPMLLWEGDLVSEQNAVLIVPSVWEWDGGESLVLQWGSALDTWLEIPTRDQPNPHRWNFTTGFLPFRVRSAIKNAPGYTDFYLEESQLFWAEGRGLVDLGTRDRPIGVRRDHGNFIVGCKGLLLTYRAAHSASASTAHGRGAGVIELRYDDEGFGHGNYSLYLQVERLP